jgi:hypothetical protein
MTNDRLELIANTLTASYGAQQHAPVRNCFEDHCKIQTGEDSQNQAMTVVKNQQAAVKGKLLEGGMSEVEASKSAGRTVTLPMPAAP